jgi:hypothetical protein
MSLKKKIYSPLLGLLNRFNKKAKRPTIRVTRRYPKLQPGLAQVPVVNGSKTMRKFVGVLLLGLVLVACSPQTGGPSIPDTGAEIGGRAELVGALEALGSTVEEAGEVDQPFFDVDAGIVQVDGQNVEVFEFPDEAARETAAGTIEPNASMIGSMIPEWVDVPHFWSAGRLIVLYVGQDQTVIDRLTSVLGQPIATGQSAVGPPPVVEPEAVLAAVNSLAQSLGVDVSQIQVVNFEQVEWPDACLGLPQTDETCAQVLTPGFRVVLDVAGVQYEVRTDETGTNVRLTQ